MEPILVGRQKLIGIIERNRARHVERHASALRGYPVKVMARIKAESRKAMDRARRRVAVFISIHYPLPESHVKEYDRVIGMLKMDTLPSIKLSAQDYDRYVRDQWEWTAAWATSNAAYDKSDPLRQRGFAKRARS